jgi:hypothetical protein
VFIGPQPSVAFAVKRDFFGLRTFIRQATVVSITEADPEATLPVPALICYTLRDDRVGSLQAVWEPLRVIQWFLRRRLAGLRALARHGARMLRRAGLRNGLRFGGTMVGGLAPARARRIVAAIIAADPQQWGDRFASARLTIAAPDAEDDFDAAPARALARLQAHAGEQLATLALDQLVICGHHVGAFLVAPDGLAGLALMLRVARSGSVAALTAIWSPAPRVLTGDE